MHLTKLLRLPHGKRADQERRRPGPARRFVPGAMAVVIVAGTLGIVGEGVAYASLTSGFAIPTQQTDPIVPGQSTYFTPISMSESSGPTYAKLTSATGLPTGASFTDSSDGCVHESSGTFTFSDAEITTTSAVAPGSYSFTTTAQGYTTNCGSTSGSSVTSAAGTLVIDAASGTGTMTVNPTTATAGSTGNTLTFDFTASSGTFGSGSKVSLAIPTGTGTAWTTPQTSNSGNPGYTTDSSGTGCTVGSPTVSSSTITVTVSSSGCTSGDSFTISYADATAQTTTGTANFTTETEESGGSFSAIGTSPTVTVIDAASGTGTMTVNPTTATAGSTGNTLTFDFTASSGTFGSGSKVSLAIPTGTGTAWTTPQTSNSGNPGYTTDSSGTGCTVGSPTVSSSTITVTVSSSGCTSGDSFTISYADATAQTTTGKANFTTETEESGGSFSAIGTSPTVTVSAAAPATASFTQEPTNTTAGNAINPAVTVTVKDAYGNVVPSSNVALTANGFSFTSGTLTEATNSSGVATFSNLVIDAAGTGYTISAADGAAAATSTSFSVSATAPATASFTQEPTNTTAGNAINPAVTVTVKDAYGNVVPSSNVALTANGFSFTSGTLTEATNSSGVATFSNLVIDAAGTGYTISAADGAAAATSTSFSVSATAPATASFTQEPTNTTAGNAINPAVTVTVKDAYGNVVPSSNVALTANGFSFTSGTLTEATNSSGVATFSNLVIDAAGTGYTISAADGAAAATSTSFSVSATAPATASFTQEPTNTTAGNAINPAVTVTVKDAYGNVVPSSNVALTANGFSFTSGTLTEATNSSGVATFSNLVIDAAGTGYTISAADGAAAATSTSFSVSATAPATASFTQEPTNTTAGNAINPAVTVTVKDAYGNVVPSSNVALTANGFSFTSGTLTEATNSSGVATFSNLVIDAAGTGYTISAADGAAAATSTSFSVTASTSSDQLVFVAQPSNGFAGAAMSPAVTVQVEDSYNNDVSESVPVALSMSSGTITSGGSATTNSSGLATFSAIVPDYAATGLTLTASSSGITSATSNPFTVSVLVRDGATLTDPNATDAGSGVYSVSYYYCSGWTVPCSPDIFIGTSMSGSASNWTYTWSSGQPTPDGAYQIVADGTDNVNNTSGPSSSIPVTVDNTAPTGSVTYTNGYQNTTSVSVTFSATDSVSGINASTGQLLRASAPLSGGTCQTFGSYSQMGSTGLSSPYADNSVASGNCYRYEYVVSDDAGNQATVTSADTVRIDSTTPSGGITSPSAGSVSGTVSLQSTNASDSVSGVASVAYYLCNPSCTGSPPGAGWTLLGTGTSGSPWTASWDTTTVPNGSYTLEAVITSNAGATSTTSAVAVTVSNTYSFVVSNPGSPTALTAGTADPNAVTVQLEVNGSATGNYLGSAYTGSHTISFSGTAMAASPSGTAATPASSSLSFNSSGQATIAASTFTFYDAQTGASLTATDSTKNIAGTSGTFTVSPTTPNKLAYNLEPPSTGTGGATLTSFGVSVEDTYGNIKTTGAGSTDTITLSLATKPSGGAFNSASGTYTNVAAVNGTATFSGIVFDTAGSYTIKASDTQSGDTGVTTVTSTPATVISDIALVGTPSSATVQNATSLIIPAPSNLTAGDVLLAQVTARDNLTTAGVTTITAPSGWTEVPTASFDGSATIFQFAYWCVVGSTGCSTSSPSWTWSWPCTNNSCGGLTVADGSGGIFEFSGVNTTTPIDIAGVSPKSTGSPVTAPSVTTSYADDEIVAMFASGGTNTFSGAPSGTDAPGTPNYNVGSANTGSCNGTANACSSNAAGVATTTVLPTAGATGTYTLACANATYAWIASTVALEP